MTVRAQWKGYLKLSLVSCPIALYPASSSDTRVSFRQINTKTGNRLKQQMVDSVTGEVVENGDKGKGYEIGKNEIIPIDKSDLEAIQVESTRIIEIDQFVARDRIDPRFLDNPYYIAPDGKVGQDAFAVIRESIRDKNVVGIGHVVLTSREHPIMLEAFGKGIRAFTLRYPCEVRDEADYFAEVADIEVPTEMLELADTIIGNKLVATFEPEKFVDTYQDALVEMIGRKKAGLPTTAKADEPKAPISNLMDSLRASIKAEKEGVRPGAGLKQHNKPTVEIELEDKAPVKAPRAKARKKAA